jgi:hypothetical protein
MAHRQPDWLAFWDRPHCIYVSARHKDVHYRLIAKEIAALVSADGARVLDYGCGEALHADLVAAVAAELVLCEAAPSVRAALLRRFGGNPKIRVLAPHEVTRLLEHSLDLIVMHSVTQYLTRSGTSALLTLFHRRCHSSRSAGGNRCLGVAALRPCQRLFPRRLVGPSPHRLIGLLAAAIAGRSDALRQRRDDRNPQRRGLRRAACVRQYRPQSGA